MNGELLRLSRGLFPQYLEHVAGLARGEVSAEHIRQLIFSGKVAVRCAFEPGQQLDPAGRGGQLGDTRNYPVDLRDGHATLAEAVLNTPG
jgi:hypothetical protein